MNDMAPLFASATAVFWLRCGLWALAGVGLLARHRDRGDQRVAFRLVAAGCLLVAGAWAVLALGGAEARPHDAFLQLLVPGTTAIGVAMLVTTPTWRHRARLLDGVVLATALAAAPVLVVGEGAGSATVVAALVLEFAGVLGLAVLTIGRSPTRLRATRGMVLVVVALVVLAAAVTGTVVAALRGVAPGAWVDTAWLVTPVLVLGIVWRPPSISPTSDSSDEVRPAPARMLVLISVALVPGLVAWLLAPTLVTAGLLVSLFATIVVGARVSVSARFDVEAARAAADVRFDALVEHAAEVLALLDGTGRIFYVSRAVEETFGVSQNRVLGVSPADLAYPDDVQRVEDLLGRVREQRGVAHHTRLRLLDGDGAPRHVEATAVDLRHVRGVGAISLTVRDVSQRIRLEAELVRQARTDALTGLVTRNVLIERVEHVMTARQPSAALLFIDLDDFKLVNDGFGHIAGDQVLVELADRIRDLIRVHDTAGRVGGDEFAILLEELKGEPTEDARRTAERLLELGRRPVIIDGEPVGIGMSIGVAVPHPGMTPTELFTAADAAMYEAKREKLGVAMFQPGMRGSSRSRLRLMRDVRAAIEDRTLSVAYQPIVAADTGAMHEVEALLRWDHPTLGSIAPDVTLEHAAAVGMTGALTNLIVDTIAVDLARWRRATGSRLPVAINLSAEQLVHVEPLDVIHRLLGDGAPEGLLTIEVTETSMLGDLAAAAEVLSVFRNAGCKVAIDDFGTGYASIGYLRRLPLDRLKIDREFIDGLTPERAPRSFAGVIQGLAAALGLITTAEGVETEEQLAAVRRLGCELVQGYLFSPALTMEDLMRWAEVKQPVSDPVRP